MQEEHSDCSVFPNLLLLLLLLRLSLSSSAHFPYFPSFSLGRRKRIPSQSQSLAVPRGDQRSDRQQSKATYLESMKIDGDQRSATMMGSVSNSIYMSCFCCPSVSCWLIQIKIWNSS